MVVVADTNALNAYLGPAPGLHPEPAAAALAPLEAVRPVHEGPFGGGLGGQTPEQHAALARGVPRTPPPPAAAPAQRAAAAAWATPALALTRPESTAAVLARRAFEPVAGPTRAPARRAPADAASLRRELRGLGPEAAEPPAPRLVAVLD
ncbi:hypothetical protein [Inmirania thermothiophila]|uniref:Uncharacterized protein n=1 Tax=Inmirania thermothiophila TaxID=1750597 RepID=A0A3N1Y2H1_9GAMM|nr:hypothetical protein [Inmirania thermothiophila]ROR32731.1 hypothetical protein EDC57_1942 [Inmirania thermothiophila]